MRPSEVTSEHCPKHQTDTGTIQLTELQTMLAFQQDFQAPYFGGEVYLDWKNLSHVYIGLTVTIRIQNQPNTAEKPHSTL